VLDVLAGQAERRVPNDPIEVRLRGWRVEEVVTLERVTVRKSSGVRVDIHAEHNGSRPDPARTREGTPADVRLEDVVSRPDG
jgi:hypothetical protein